jgi:intein-encoded DNA endonuclease-like protein
MENQVLSLELCKKFKELGIEIKTKFVYVVMNTFSKTENMQLPILVTMDSLVLESMCWYKKEESNNYEEHYPAPTLSELLEIVPAIIEKNGRKYWFELTKSFDDEGEVYCSAYVNFENYYLEEFIDQSPIEAVGKLLLYLKKNNLI